MNIAAIRIAKYEEKGRAELRKLASGGWLDWGVGQFDRDGKHSGSRRGRTGKGRQRGSHSPVARSTREHPEDVWRSGRPIPAGPPEPGQERYRREGHQVYAEEDDESPAVRIAELDELLI